MFRTVPLSTIRSFSLYTQQWYMSFSFAVCTVKNSWWWIEELSETCRVLFQNYIWETSEYGWFYYKNLSRGTVNWTSNLLSVVLFMIVKIAFNLISDARIPLLQFVCANVQYYLNMIHFLWRVHSVSPSVSRPAHFSYWPTALNRSAYNSTLAGQPYSTIRRLIKIWVKIQHK